jgi:hypothetical protein
VYLGSWLGRHQGIYFYHVEASRIVDVSRNCYSPVRDLVYWVDILEYGREAGYSLSSRQSTVGVVRVVVAHASIATWPVRTVEVSCSRFHVDAHTLRLWMTNEAKTIAISAAESDILASRKVFS